MPSNSRANGGFSLRRSLEDNGVRTEAGMRTHLDFIARSLETFPRLDITRYRPRPNNPETIYHG